MSANMDSGKKHIAMYIGSLNKGGAERVMCNLAEYFYNAGYQVTLVTTYLADDEYEVADRKWEPVMEKDKADEPGRLIKVLNMDEHIKTVRMKSSEEPGIDRVFTALMPDEKGKRVANFRNRVKKLRDTWKSLKPDLILSFLGKNNCMAIYSARGLGIPVVVSVRSNPSREYGSKGLNLAMNMLFPKAAGVVVQTTGAAEYFKDCIRKKCWILPNSINPSFMKGNIVPFSERKNTIVSVGRLDDNKNQILLIRAFGKIMDEFPDYRLVIYGDGPSRKKFEKEAAGIEAARSAGTSGSSDDHTDGNRIVFMGNVSGVADKIRDAKIFVLTSKQEGMPNALIEAMSMGLACISTDCPCGGPRDLIRDGENGILIPMGEDSAMEDSLAKALRSLISDAKKCEAMADAALAVRKDYSPEKINSQWKEYFEGLMRDT
ncbi:glycosyltransferase [Butyrivibrio sp. MB2005]|uniref:glycosyltransferase n=1 Tax=Butyrivibrio sp. MB2005 TaxID=1280678 RepID=UPI00041410CD|nr:glycosyltransferase [Butyrivibrio sp. MB2005]